MRTVDSARRATVRIASMWTFNEDEAKRLLETFSSVGYDRGSGQPDLYVSVTTEDGATVTGTIAFLHDTDAPTTDPPTYKATFSLIDQDGSAPRHVDVPWSGITRLSIEYRS